MTSREIITMPEVGLSATEQGDYIVSKPGHQSYKIRPTSRTYTIVKVLDTRCQAQQRRYEMANDTIWHLESKLKAIEESKAYKFLAFIERLFHQC